MPSYSFRSNLDLNIVFHYVSLQGFFADFLFNSEVFSVSLVYNVDLSKKNVRTYAIVKIYILIMIPGKSAMPECKFYSWKYFSVALTCNVLNNFAWGIIYSTETILEDNYIYLAPFITVLCSPVDLLRF